MTAALSLQDINGKIEDLSEIQAKLIQDLKEKHKEAYEWLVENDINLSDLTEHADKIAASLMAALAITISVNTVKKIDFNLPVHTTSSVVINMSTLTQEEKIGAEVWQKYGDLINTTAQKYNLNPDVIYATIMVESMGNPKATRYEPHINDSSYGLGQILSSTARYLGFSGNAEELYDPQVSIDLIGRYHRRTLDVYGELSPDKLATAYNAGSPYGHPIYGHIAKFAKWMNLSAKLGGASYARI